MTEIELHINEHPVGQKYLKKINGEEVLMDKLMESPGLRIINHSKAGEGYWNYKKMAIQTKNVMTAMDTLHPHTSNSYISLIEFPDITKN